MDVVGAGHSGIHDARPSKGNRESPHDFDDVFVVVCSFSGGRGGLGVPVVALADEGPEPTGRQISAPRTQGRRLAEVDECDSPDSKSRTHQHQGGALTGEDSFTSSWP